MKTVKIYSTPVCPYCTKAKAWLTENNIAYDEVMLTDQEAIGQFKEECPGLTSVPQILVDGVLHEGGHDGLMANKEGFKKLVEG